MRTEWELYAPGNMYVLHQSPAVCQLLQRTADHPGSLGGSVRKDDGRCLPSTDQLARVRLPGRE